MALSATLTDPPGVAVRFYVPGVPTAAGRARMDTRGAKPHMHAPKDNIAWADVVRTAFDRQKPDDFAPFGRGEPVMLDAQFRFPRPASHFGTGRNAGTLKPSAPRFHTSGNKRGDLDNLLKLLQDALKGYAWHDDGQIAAYGGHTEKLYVEDRPGVLVEIRPLT